MPDAQTRTGIECPKCGHGTSVHKTVNYVSWLKRVRICKNERCRYIFATKEIRMKEEATTHQGQSDLFGGD